MKFFKKYRKIIILLVIAALLVSYSIIIVTRPYGNFTGSFFTQEFLRLDPIFLRVGETYDMTDLMREAETGLNLKARMQAEGAFRLSASKGSIEIKGTKVKAASCGIGYAHYGYSYLAYREKIKNTLHAETAKKDLFQASFIIISKESEYVEVHSLDDLTEENKTFILKNDIVASEPYNRSYLLNTFKGVFINPDGYTITIEESAGLSSICVNNLGVFDGINMSAELGYCNTSLIPICGLAVFNEGLINNCELEASLETRSGSLRLINIHNSRLRCAFMMIALEDTNHPKYSYLYNNLLNCDIEFTFSGDTEQISEGDFYLPKNNSYRVIIEPNE